MNATIRSEIVHLRRRHKIVVIDTFKDLAVGFLRLAAIAFNELCRRGTQRLVNSGVAGSKRALDTFTSVQTNPHSFRLETSRFLSM